MERTLKVKTWVESPYLNRVRRLDKALGEERALRLKLQERLTTTEKRLLELKREREEILKLLKEERKKTKKLSKTIKVMRKETEELKKANRLYLFFLSFTLLALLTLVVKRLL